MRKIFLLVLALLPAVGLLKAQTPAFPTAEGYGMYTTGGRGGEVVEVTNLLDDPSNPPEGSFRWALKQYKGQPITIVFRVSGTIDLKGNDLRNTRSDITIAGQTAPGDGICFKNGTINLGGSRNLIIRHIRSRVGTLNDDTYDPTQVPGSANFIAGACLNIENGGQFIVDHCTFSWSAEENVGFYDNDHTTVQWCMFNEGLYDAGHGKGARSYGAVLGGKTATYHHNLLAHNYNRSPRFGATTKNDVVMLLDFVNNVNYNWGKQSSCYGGDNRQGDAGLFQLNFVNNYYKPGPARDGSQKSYFIGASYCNPDQGSQGKSYGKWHLSGNYIEGTANSDFNTDNYKGFDISAYTEAVKGLTLADMKSDHIEVEYPVRTETAEQAFESVLAGAGAFPRDTLDRRIVKEVRTGTAECYGTLNKGRTKGIINKGSDAGGWPELQTYNEITDADHDGMDDAWETAHGFDPTDRSDRNIVLKSGYTVLEAYLNSLCGEEIAIEYAQPYDIVVAQDGSGDYTTIMAAINAVPEDGKRHLIFVRNGTYDEKVYIGTHKSGTKKIISLIGESRDGVVITHNDCHETVVNDPTEGNKSGGAYAATMTVNASDFYMENVTVENSYGKGSQAEALYQKGDRHVLRNCRITGYQDTHRSNKGGRYFFYQCVIEGGVDYIYAGGMCYFYQCDIVSTRGGHIAAPEDVTYKATLSDGNPLYYTFFFQECNLKAGDGVTSGCYLGRPWGDKSGAIYMDCRLGSHIEKDGWSKMGDETWKDCCFGEYNSLTADGKSAADVSRRVSWSRQISERDRCFLMTWDVISQTINSKSTFDPTQTLMLATPQSLTNKNNYLSWTACEGAVAYAVYLDGKFLAFTGGNSYYDKDGHSGTFTVRAIGANGCQSALSGTANVATPETMKASLNPSYRANVTTESAPAIGGTATASAARVLVGNQATVSASAAYGYKFSCWKDATGKEVSTDSIYTFTVADDIALTACFEVTTLYELSVEMYNAPISYLSFSPSPIEQDGKLLFTAGSLVTVTAASDPFYQFSNWEGGNSESTLEVTMTGARRIQAIYTAYPAIVAWTFAGSFCEYYPADIYASQDNQGVFNFYNEAYDMNSVWTASTVDGRTGVQGIDELEEAYLPTIDFSAEGASHLQVFFSAAFNGNGYKRQSLCYATEEGGDLTPCASFEMEQSGKWYDFSAELPEAVDNQRFVRLCLKPDESSAILGSAGRNGMTVTDIYVRQNLPTRLQTAAEIDSSLPLDVFDLCGRRLKTSVPAADWKAGLPKGLYLIRQSSAQGTISQVQSLR